jgi:hypothetical protein
MAKQDESEARKQGGKDGGLIGVVRTAVDAVASAVDGAVTHVADAAKSGNPTKRHDEHARGHKAAKAHGQATKVDTSLPSNRAALLDRHAEARRRRNAAPLGSDAHREAVDEIGRIEIRIAAVERAMTPPKG